MENNDTIEIFARIRPLFRSKGNRKRYILDAPASEDKQPQLHFHLPKDEAQGLINNTRENYDFYFNRVFDQDSRQDEVFSIIAKDVVDDLLKGINGTIFAYGQTGSGKTFTMTGGAESYDDRGVIPRTIQYLFSQISKDTRRQYQVAISYLEIYNESGYDLLQSRDYSRLEELDKIIIGEDSNDNIVLRNLSVHPVHSDEEALNLLFLGDTNKIIAETPSNPASSRSHCIFTLTVSSSEIGSEMIRRSKLHLVDLAGSERVSRTRVDGVILKEAKYINLSLHFLEQVIIALHEQAQGIRSHIPYRNSVMTTLLRDSLGGNCRTKMIATLAVEQELLEESISTCRFAQRVALIKNNATVNEELDLNCVVEKLKQQVTALKAELTLLKGSDYDDSPLEEFEIRRVRLEVERFLETGLDNGLIEGADMRKIREAFRVLREFATVSGVKFSDDKVHELKEQLEQRNVEIGILVSSLEEEKQKNLSPLAETMHNMYQRQITRDLTEHPAVEETIKEPELVSEIYRPTLSPRTEIREEGKSISDRARHFDEFKRENSQFQKIRELRDQFKLKQSEAKQLGQQCQMMKDKLKEQKGNLERLQMQKLIALTSADGSEGQIDTVIHRFKEDLRRDKDAYKTNVALLKEMKQEIDHLHHSIEQMKLQTEKQFDEWLIKKKGQSILFEDEVPKIRREIARIKDFGLQDKSVEDDIAAFFKAKQELMRKK